MRVIWKALTAMLMWAVIGQTAWAAPSPGLTIAVNPFPLVVNQTARITIVASNAGPDAADNVVVTDGVPNNMGILGVSASQGDVSVYNSAVTVRIGHLDPGQTVTIYVDVVVVAAYPSDAPFNNCAGLTYADGTARLSCLPNQSAVTQPGRPASTLPPNGQRPIADPNRPPVLLPVSGAAPFDIAGPALILGGLSLLSGLAVKRRRG
jgi:uncharacterized repeat protein (TIGR01451 family)